MPLQIPALRRTSSQDMPNGFRRHAVQSAHDLNLRPRSCLLAVINSCKNQLFVNLVHASNNICGTCPPPAYPSKATVSLFCIVPSRCDQLPLPILARHLFLYLLLLSAPQHANSSTTPHWLFEEKILIQWSSAVEQFTNRITASDFLEWF